MKKSTVWILLIAVILVSCDLAVTELASDGPVTLVSATEQDVPFRFVVRNSSHDSGGSATVRKVKIAVRYRQNPGFTGLPFVAPFKIRDAGGATITADATPDASGFAWYWWFDLASLASTGSSVAVRGTARVRCPATECSSVSIVVEFDSCSGEEFAQPYCRIQEEDENNNRSPELVVPIPGRCATSQQLSTIHSGFRDCHSASSIGQTRSVSGVSCEQVCCTFGYAGCSHRGPQADYNACVSPGAPEVGTCDESFASSWSSQCVCVP